jgi:acetoin:2,6-dichlorophenolindophenol oxidoreductase subunit alpha
VIERVSDVIAPYGIERETVDGKDAAAVHEAFGYFLAKARAGDGPFLLECLTKRLRGHYEGDSTKYDNAEGDDPLFGHEPDAAAADEVERAVEFARESPYPVGTQGFVYA